jgi:putrescine transport system ATP-binding protein
VATPDRIYETPNSVYVADFIGDVNILRGTARPSGDGMYDIVQSEGAPALVAKSERAFAEDQTCFLAIRPEKVSISVEMPAADNALQGKILDIAYLGNLSTYHVELADGQIIKAQTANTRRISRRSFTWEDPVWVSWTATAGVMLEG